MIRYFDLTGQSFNRWTVIKFHHSNKEAFWECLCLCGTIAIVRSGDLKSNRSKSCGCLRKERILAINKSRLMAPNMGAISTLYKQYQRSAIRRNLKFALTLEQFINLTSSNCVYCDAIPSAQRFTNGGLYTYNGIDRIDSDVGYVLDNCVTACKICNFAKGSMSQEFFLNHIRKIIHNLDDSTNKV